MAGLEPATILWYEWRRFILGTLTTMTTKTLYQLELHDRPCIIYVERSHCKLLEATPARNPAALLGLHQSFVSSVLISAFLRLIRLSFSPTLPSALRYYLSSYHVTYLVGLAGFGNYLVAFGCTYGLNTVHFHSVGLSVYFAAVLTSATYRLAPWLLAPRR